MHHGHTYLQPNTRACAYGRIFFRMRSARNCFGAAFSAPAKTNFDTPDKASTVASHMESPRRLASCNSIHCPMHGFLHRYTLSSVPTANRSYVPDVVTWFAVPGTSLHSSLPSTGLQNILLRLSTPHTSLSPPSICLRRPSTLIQSPEQGFLHLNMLL